MKNISRLLIPLVLLAGIVAGLAIERFLISPPQQSAVADVGFDLEHARKHLDPNYVCPMHPQIVSGKPGTCPICGMDLVPIKKDTADLESIDGRPVVSVSPSVINNLGVRVAQVERTTLVRQIETPGFIQQIKKDKHSLLRAPAKGRVTHFHFTRGQWMETGDLLVDIELDDLVMVQERHLELIASEKLVASTGDENDASGENQAKQPPVTEPGTERAGTAGETSADAEAPVVPETPARLTSAATRRLLLRVGMSEQDIERLEITGETSAVISLYAPHPGIVEDILVSEGESVKANSVLFGVAGLMRATVLANAFQRDAAWIRPGQPVDIIMPHEAGKVWKGVVTQGAVTINPTSQNIGVKLAFTVPLNLVKVGMYVIGNIYGQVRENVLAVPREAIIYTQNEQRVILALGEGRFKPVKVKTGITTGTQVEILEGLEDGDTIVVSSQFLIDSESSMQASYRRMRGVE